MTAALSPGPHVYSGRGACHGHGHWRLCEPEPPLAAPVPLEVKGEAGLRLEGHLACPTCQSWAAGAGSWPEGKGLPACASGREQEEPVGLQLPAAPTSPGTGPACHPRPGAPPGNHCPHRGQVKGPSLCLAGNPTPNEEIHISWVCGREFLAHQRFKSTLIFFLFPK